MSGQTPDLPKPQLQLRELELDNVELEIGRPAPKPISSILEQAANVCERRVMEQERVPMDDGYSSQEGLEEVLGLGSEW